MKKRWIIVILAGAVALALVGCTRTDRSAAQTGRGFGGGYASTTQTAPAARGAGGFRVAEAPAPRVADPASDRTGREVADIGSLETLQGLLSVENGEWYLETEDGTYLLHLGNPGWLGRIGLVPKEGSTAEVRGLVNEDEVSVVSVAIDGELYELRADDGAPRWAGAGRRGSTGAQGSAGRGGGQGRGARA